MSFSQLGLSSSLLATLAEEGYENPTPIQTQAIPIILGGRDLLGLAQTGTGKTAAFALPILDLFNKKAGRTGRRGPRCLVLTPTRELAIQVAESFSTYGRKAKLGVAVVYGGVGIEPQKAALRRKPEILVATPGRLLDLMGQRECDLSDIEVFVLDEADRMFDMGFIRDIRKVVAVIPKDRQTLLFSATMPGEIEDLARGILNDPGRVEVTPVSRTAETIEQFAYFVDAKNRVPLMVDLLGSHNVKRCMVFTRMKHVANRIAEQLRKEGVSAEPFHSNKSQAARQKALAAFKAGECRVLVATDIAARGLDVEEVEVVINYDLPEVPETYVHRIGRAGRAGRTGIAWALVEGDQRDLLRDIERVTGCKPTVVEDHHFASDSSRTAQSDHDVSRAAGHKRSSGPRMSPQQRAQREMRREHEDGGGAPSGGRGGFGSGGGRGGFGSGGGRSGSGGGAPRGTSAGGRAPSGGGSAGSGRGTSSGRFGSGAREGSRDTGAPRAAAASQATREPREQREPRGDAPRNDAPRENREPRTEQRPALRNDAPRENREPRTEQRPAPRRSETANPRNPGQDAESYARGGAKKSTDHTDARTSASPSPRRESSNGQGGTNSRPRRENPGSSSAAPRREASAGGGAPRTAGAPGGGAPRAAGAPGGGAPRGRGRGGRRNDETNTPNSDNSTGDQKKKKMWLFGR